MTEERSVISADYQHHIAIHLQEPTPVFELALILEPLRLYNRFCGHDFFTWSIFAYAEPREGAPTSWQSAVRIDQGEAFFPLEQTDTTAERSDNHADDLAIFLVHRPNAACTFHPALRAALHKASGEDTPLALIGSAFWMLAEDDLLKQRRVSVPWWHWDQALATFPGLQASSHPVEWQDMFFSCAGGMAVMTMMLHYLSHVLDAQSVVQIEEICLYQRQSEAMAHQPNIDSAATSGLLRSIIDLMGEHITKPLDRFTLARQVGISVKQMERLFQKADYKPPMQYYRDLRLEKARQALCTGTLPINIIAADCGFRSSSHFTRCYSERFGCTPKEERAMQARNHRTP